MFTLGEKYRIIRKYEDHQFAFDEAYEIDYVAVTKAESRDKGTYPDDYYITFSQSFGSGGTGGKCSISAGYKDGVWYDPLGISFDTKLDWEIIKL